MIKRTRSKKKDVDETPPPEHGRDTKSEKALSVMTSFLSSPNFIFQEYSEKPSKFRCYCGLQESFSSFVKCSLCKNHLHLECVRLKKRVDPFVCLFCQYRLSQKLRESISAQLRNLPKLESFDLEKAPVIFDTVNNTFDRIVDIWKALPDIIRPIEESYPPDFYQISDIEK